MLKISRIISRVFSSENKQTLPIKLTLYTKTNCQLCDEAKEFLEENYPNKFIIKEVDITKSRELFRKFKLDIPVFYHNNEFLMQHKVDVEKIEDLLKGL